MPPCFSVYIDAVSYTHLNLEPTLLEKYAELKRPKELTDLGIMCCMECLSLIHI